MITVVSIAWLPAAVATAGALVGMIADMSGRIRFGLHAVAAALLVSSALCLGRTMLPATAAGTTIEQVFGVILVGGGFSGYAFAIYFLGFLSVGTGLSSVREPARVGVAALIALGSVAGQVLVGAFDLAVLFVALEAIALVGYALVAAGGTDRSDEAAARYFVQGAVATGLTVYGLAIVVGLGGGGTGYNGMLDGLARVGPQGALLGAMLLLTALAFKLGAFPFHSWAPDAYETAPPAAAAFLSSGPKVAALGAFIFLVGRAFGPAVLGQFDAALAVTLGPITTIVAVVAVASIAFGNFAALKQTSVTRMLGYSGIAQVGYAFVGVGSDVPGATLFAVTYAFGVAGAFLAIEALRSALPEWDGSVSGLAGVAKTCPAASFALAVSMLSLTGIPLTAGFWGKALVFLGGIEAGTVWIVVVGVVGSVVSFGYYGRVIRALYIDAPPEAGETAVAAGSANVWPAVVAAVMVIGFGTIPMITGLDWVSRVFGM
jgi:NADH-quinone oxidoreductase subunit N